MRILIAEDEDFSRQLLQGQLEQLGHEVIAVADGLDAWQKLETEQISLLITDWMMPGLDGLQLVRRIRARKGSTYVYVILLTAKSDTRDVVQGIMEGADDFLTKPYDRDELNVRIRAGQRIIELESRLVAHNAELASTKDKLEFANSRMKKDLDAAARIQKSLLPAMTPKHRLIDCAWIFRPCDELAGDIFNVIELDDDYVGFYVLDVVGHGVPAALLSVTLSRVLSPTLGASSVLFASGPAGQRPATPSELAQELNRRFPMADDNGQYFTMLFGSLNTKTGEVRYVSAGHPGPVYVPVDGLPRLLDGSGFPIGICEGADYADERLSLNLGDRIFVYSDGLLDAQNPMGERFGKAGLLSFFDKRYHSLGQSVRLLEDAVTCWCADCRPLDDISVLAMGIVAMDARKRVGD